MTKRKGPHSHYELMFEDYMISNQILYIAIDEKRKPLIDDEHVKNFDFIVSSFNGKFLVELKGKNFAARPWENWVHVSDLSGLKKWGNYFNAFVPLLVFTYIIKNSEDKDALAEYADIRVFGKDTYGVLAVTLADYYSKAKKRATKIDAIDVPKNEFMNICKPISYFIPEFKKNW